MNIDRSQIQSEIRRITKGPNLSEKPSGAGIVRFVARCPMGSDNVLTNVVSVLMLVDELTLAGCVDPQKLSKQLPDWFIEACAPAMTQEQAERWLKWWKKLSPEDQSKAEIEKDWSLDNWLYWMLPANRQWFWWDAKSLSDVDHIALAIEVQCWPFPWGSLRWLFKAAGASALEPEE